MCVCVFECLWNDLEDVVGFSGLDDVIRLLRYVFLFFWFRRWFEWFFR